MTHVIRGEEWISSLPKHVLLYERFGWAPPAFCHLPLLRNPDRSKLSKRKNPTNVLYYRQIGILPEALKNHLGLMGWSMPDGRELFTIDEMVEAFSLERISLGGPVFDLAKLEWLNGRWMREKLTGDALYERVLDWMNLGDRMRRAVALAQPRAQRLTDVMGLIGFLFQGEIVMREDLIPQGDERAAAISLYDDVITRIAEMEEWNRDAIERLLRAVAESRGEKLRSIVQPLYLALTGSRTSIPLFEAMEFLGKDVCRQRLRTARDLLDKKSQESNS